MCTPGAPPAELINGNGSFRLPMLRPAFRSLLNSTAPTARVCVGAAQRARGLSANPDTNALYAFAPSPLQEFRYALLFFGLLAFCLRGLPGVCNAWGRLHRVMRRAVI